jgi:chemotaxis methyl-accepting protein methylase
MHFDHFLKIAAPALDLNWRKYRRRVDSRSREAASFREHNLLEDPPPRGQDLVLCRYLAFTYYRGERRLHAALRPGGALMIGRKEELGQAADLFAPWPDAPGVFRPASPLRHTTRRFDP